MKKLILFAIILGGFFTACQKTTETPAPKDEIARAWRIYEWSAVTPGGDTVTYSKSLLADATQTFQKDGLYTINIPRADVKDKRGTWEVSASGKTMYWNKDTDSAMTFKIDQLNTFMLKISSADPRMPANITYVPYDNVE